MGPAGPRARVLVFEPENLAAAVSAPRLIGAASKRGDGKFHVVFPRNAAIPNAKAIKATTSFDRRTELAMRIYEGPRESA